MKKTIGYAVVVLCIVATTLFSGCVAKKSKIDENTNTKQALHRKMDRDDIKDGVIKDSAILMSIGDIDVTYSEAMVYVMLYKSDYAGLLSKDVWSYEVEEDRTFDMAVKECIINQIVKSKIIEYGATKIGVVVEPDEKIEIEDKAIECYKEVFEKLEGKYGITQAVVKDVLYDNYLADKVYEVATNDVDIVVKDSESKVPIVKQLAVLYKGYDAEGHKIDRSKQRAHEIIVEAQNKILQEEMTFTETALEYSDLSDIELKLTVDASSTTIKRAAAKLNKDELSDIIETREGYYLLVCVDENDEDEEKDNIERIIQLRQDEIFAKKYDEWLNSNEIYIVSDLWNMISMSDV